MRFTSHNLDYLIIGAGIVGLSIARDIKSPKPNAKIRMLEKESRLGLHASGRNSGVLHTGIFYPPGWSQTGSNPLSRWASVPNWSSPAKAGWKWTLWWNRAGTLCMCSMRFPQHSPALSPMQHGWLRNLYIPQDHQESNPKSMPDPIIIRNTKWRAI